MTKVTELIKSKAQLFSYSFEVTPDVSEEEIDNLEGSPDFFSVTWHAKSHHCKDLNIGPLAIANILVRKQKHVLMHLSCDRLKEDYLKQLLNRFQEENICNLFLVLGEGYDSKTSDFKTTSHLIKFIRQQTGNYFCIGVAGFPDCSDKKLLQTKEKIESGADFIITQAFFESNTFKNFKERCENVNVKVPIIPGIFLFESFKQLTGFINLCKVKVSNNLLELVKNREELSEPGLEVVKCLLHDLNIGYQIKHFHFFTLNKLQVVTKFIQSCHNDNEWKRQE